MRGLWAWVLNYCSQKFWREASGCFFVVWLVLWFCCFAWFVFLGNSTASFPGKMIVGWCHCLWVCLSFGHRCPYSWLGWKPVARWKKIGNSLESRVKIRLAARKNDKLCAVGSFSQGAPWNTTVLRIPAAESWGDSIACLPGFSLFCFSGYEAPDWSELSYHWLLQILYRLRTYRVFL